MRALPRPETTPRTRCLRYCLALVLCAGGVSLACAGNQQYVPLADSVKSSLRASIADHRGGQDGCVILRYYLDIENNNLFRALGRYNGSLGRPEYPNAVMGALRTAWTYEDPQRRKVVAQQ